MAIEQWIDVPLMVGTGNSSNSSRWRELGEHLSLTGINKLDGITETTIVSICWLRLPHAMIWHLNKYPLYQRF